MNLEKLKSVAFRVLSGLMLCLTFGLFSTSRAEVRSQAQPPAVAVCSETSDSLLSDLKTRVRADYRNNIAGYFDHAQM